MSIKTSILSNKATGSDRSCRPAFHSRPTHLPAIESPSDRRHLLPYHILVTALILACGLWLVWSALGATPALAAGIETTEPITNAVGVDLNANIVATYTAAISPTTVTTRTFVTQGIYVSLCFG